MSISFFFLVTKCVPATRWKLSIERTTELTSRRYGSIRRLEQLAQATNIEPILSRLIYPARLVFRVPSHRSKRINEFGVE